MAIEEKDLLVFQVSRLPEEGLDFDREFSPEWLVNIPEYAGESATRIKGGIMVRGTIMLEGESLLVRGLVFTELSTFCTRCGESMVYSLEGKVEMALLPGPPPELPSEMEITAEDAAAEYYQGDEVDLAGFFQEAVALQVPIQSLCREDCKGLCPRCGTNLNFETCNCEEEEGDPRLAPLRNLKIE